LAGAGTTAIVEHGANPGLIPTREAGLVDIGARVLADKKVDAPAADEIAQLMADRTFNRWR